LIELIELNKVYKMDNLELLNQLPNNYIDLIYCDILYNTGRKFKDYNDNLGTPQQAIEWYKPRIKEMYRVLKDTGSIYLHCDWHLNSYIRVLLDELFGYKNFRNEIIWHYSGIKRSTARNFPQKHDSIYSYTKSDTYVWNVQYKQHKKEYLKRFKPDETGRLCRQDVNPTNGGKRKIYLDEVKGDIVDSLWNDIYVLNPMANERINYDTQKPKSLLERIIKSSSNENDIVLDLFCGSGTSMVVAKELGRKYIGCDISERAIEISEKRLNEIV